jgi:alpha-2-macroglobulin
MLPHPSQKSIRPVRSSRPLLLIVLNLLLVVSLACSLPGIFGPSPTSTPTAEPTGIVPGSEVITPQAPAEPLPPALVETYPPPGAELPLSGPITLYFNQPMDTASVEGAFSGQPNLSGHFNWQGNTKVSFTPDAPFLPGTDMALRLDSTARSQRGMALLNPLTLTYRTVGFLELAQVLPEAGSMDVNPTSAIVASFNRPVVPLGAGSTPDGSNHPPAFTIGSTTDPDPSGFGEWINTSTYIFYPEPALAGGMLYTVSVNPELTGVDGSPLDLSEGSDLVSEVSWSFTTSEPRVVSSMPVPFSTAVRLDQKVSITFNQPMDSASVAANFSLVGEDGQPLDGEMDWNEDFTELTFTPSSLYPRFARLTAALPASTLARGGTELGEDFQASFTTSPELGVLSTEPVQGGINPVYNGITLEFTSQLPADDQLPGITLPMDDLLRLITITPRVPNLSAYLMEDERTVILYGEFAPSTSYTLTVSDQLEDAWGDRMEEPYILDFTSATLDPELLVNMGTDVLFLTSEDNSILAQATNASSVQVTIGSVPVDDFLLMLSPNGYDIRMTYQPRNARALTQALVLPPNRSQVVDISLTANDEPLGTGLYYVKTNVTGAIHQGGALLLVSSNIHLTLKSSTSDVFIWAVDLRDQTPVAGAPVSVYDENGVVIARGVTDAEGIFHAPIDALSSPYMSTYAVLGQPGEEDFGVALSNWSFGINPWDFGITPDYNPSDQKTYLYTDRPIYRPGDTVYFRLVSRQTEGGIYALPDAAPQTIRIYDGMGMELATLELPLSVYGTASGEYTLLPEAQPGNYRLGEGDDALWFQVANYRKPEINLQVAFDKQEILADEKLSATLNARYFFDAPVSNLEVHWAVYAAPEDYVLPGYQVGPMNINWFNPYMRMYLVGLAPLGMLVSEGEGVLGRDGRLALDVPVEAGDLLPDTGRYRLTLEVTLSEIGRLPVSARASVLVNPAEFIIGIKPDTWTVRAEEQATFEIFAAGWEGEPAGVKSLRADFQKVTWIRQEPAQRFLSAEYVPQYTYVGSTDFRTGSDGLARVAFTPPEPGTYQLDVYEEGAQSGAQSGARSGARNGARSGARNDGARCCCGWVGLGARYGRSCPTSAST